MAWDFLKKIVRVGKDSETQPLNSPTPSQPRGHGFGRAAPRTPIENAAPPLPTANCAEAMISRMAEDSQRQANLADDVWKKKYRAHVERSVPQITSDGSEALRRALNSALAIRHLFPPRLPQRSLSFLGGAPVVPDDFDWPILHNKEGLLERLTFMAQIDCAEIPAGPARDLLPKCGYLYFFAPMSLNFGPDAHHFVTRYLPGPARKSWEPSTFPGLGTIASISDDVVAYRGSKESYSKIEIELGWLEEPNDEEIEARQAEGLPHEVAQAMRKGARLPFLAPSEQASVASASPVAVM